MLTKKLFNDNCAFRIGVAEIYTTTYAIYYYAYNLTDHLGNVRAVVSKDGDNLEMVSISDFYPFGMEMPGRLKVPSEGQYRFDYQGQFAERDEETGYNQFELRLWDNRIGRWQTIDPAGQYHSPYLGMGNNPVIGVDPDGSLIDRFEYIFNSETGEYEFSRRIDEAGPDYAVVVDAQGNELSGKFIFWDQSIVDLDFINHTMDKLNLDFVDLEYSYKLEDVMEKSGVNNPDNGLLYIKNESPQGGKMDYAKKYLTDKTMYARGMYVYNKGDFGNYLWGQGMKRLGIGLTLSLLGAEYNNVKDWWKECIGIKSSTGKSNYGGVTFWDSESDQGAIIRGWYNF